MTTTSTTPLQQVLSLTTSLHNNNSDGKKSSALSLRQLVPVHESLLQAVLSFLSVSTTSTSTTTAIPIPTATATEHPDDQHQQPTPTTITDGLLDPDETGSFPSSVSAQQQDQQQQLSSLLMSLLNVSETNEDLIQCVEVLRDASGSDSSRRQKLLVLQYLLLCNNNSNSNNRRRDKKKKQQDVDDDDSLWPERLSLILLPLVPWMLLSSSSSSYSTTATTDETDFLEAVLDAVFSPFLSEPTSRICGGGGDVVNVIDDDEELDDPRLLQRRQRRLQSCFAQLRNTTTTNNNNAREHWILACRILTRIHQNVMNTSSTNTSSEDVSSSHKEEEQKAEQLKFLVRDAVVQQILAGLDLVAATSSTSSHNKRVLCPPAWILPSIHNDLLPLLLSSSSSSVVVGGKKKEEEDHYPKQQNSYYKDHLVPIWEHVWKIYHQDPNHPDDAKNRWMLVTAILCAILPSLLNQDLSVSVLVPPNTSTSGSSGSASYCCRPLHCPLLWKLIHQCLSQGLYVIKKQSWIEESWAGGGGSSSGAGDASSSDSTTTPASNKVDLGTSQLLRRRGLYLLGALVEGGCSADDTDSRVVLWKKYVACFETIEMEHAAHLIDQTWETVAEIGSQLMEIDSNGDDKEKDDDVDDLFSSTAGPPRVSWKWMYPMLARVITSNEAPSLRKLTLYRLFQGQAGILVGEPPVVVEPASQKKKNKTGNRPAQAASGLRGAPLRVVTPAFVLEVILPAFDTLESSVGCMMHLEQDRKEVRHDMYHLLGRFLDAYLACLDDPKCESFFRGLWSNDVFCQLNRKTTVAVCSAIAESLRRKPEFRIPTRPDMYSAAVESLRDLFSLGSLIPSQRDSLIESMAVMLSRCRPVEQLPPPLLLSVLALFPIATRHQPDLGEGSTNYVPGKKEEKSASIVQVSWIENDPIYSSLQRWVSNVCSSQPGLTSTFGATIATAYVDGLLLSSSPSSGGANHHPWNPCAGASSAERDCGKAVALLCTLLPNLGNVRHSATTTAPTTTPGELLWPAISKGLASVPMLLVSKSWFKADSVTRALILLESGCKLHVLSGLGNGDLVVDRKTQQMMPPPLNVENLVRLGVSFLVHHIQHLFLPAADRPSSEPKVLSATFMSLVSQLETLHEGYPSSMTIPEAVNKILHDSLNALSDQKAGNVTSSVLFSTTVYAALVCGGEINNHNLLELCGDLMELKYSSSMQSKDDQGARSVFEYAKWAALSILLKRLFDTMSGNDVDSFVDRLVDEAIESVQSASDLTPIFDCVLTAAKIGLVPSETRGHKTSAAHVDHLDKLIRSFVRVMQDCKGSGRVAFMLDESTALLFRPELLLDEAERLMSDPSSKAPLRTAFRDFVQLAGTKRHHILEAVLCRITAGWMGPSTRSDAAGISAVPFLTDITSLLFYKEERLDESSLGQTDWRKDRSGQFTVLPTVTHESSVTRGFLLQFLSQLPDVESGLSPIVLSDLLNPMIYRLLEEVKPLTQGTVSLGSIDFIRKIRGWQALCVLSRFIVAETAEYICARVFEAIGEMLYGQIRYFIEVFTIQCCRKHPVVFGKALVKQIVRTDLSLQQVSSLMIVAGNLVVGRYRDDFFRQYDMLEAKEDGCVTPLDLLLSGLIPWLGSTQGFSRAIAQLLVHKLVPMVIDIKVPSAESDSNWYLLSIYKFLEENSEMKRLRSKQTKFFDQYDVDSVCTTEGILSIKVDDGGEALPIHAVEVMKECLRQVYEEANANNAPTWKHLEGIAQAQQQGTSFGPVPPSSNVGVSADVGAVVNFQRKIIPIDALNLALEDMRQVRLRNRAGRKKQKLIVCATFCDKIPNLGGLARTAEIFAAERLVIPDLRVTKTDNFKSLSVSAGDWIEIEECKEENLLSWLLDRKREGYFVVGLEQTSSSVSLKDFAFPPDRPIVLLLGKEKEGIPVDFLQAVDQCVEIPQLGIIRSLNVHVSAAVAIWEQTRQSLASGKLVL